MNIELKPLNRVCVLSKYVQHICKLCPILTTKILPLYFKIQLLYFRMGHSCRKYMLECNFNSACNISCPQLCKWRRQWQPTPALLPGKSYGSRSLVGCSPWGLKESDMAEWLHFHFSLSCIGEGNGNPLQCSCLENPSDGRAWWAAVCGVAESQTWL